MANADRRACRQSCGELFQLLHDLEEHVRGTALGFDATVALLWLREHQRSSAGEVSEGLCFSPAKTTRCLKELASLGLVEEFVEPDDARKCRFRLSPKGENVAFEIVKAFGKKTVAAQLDGFAAMRRAARAVGKRQGGRVVTSTVQKLLLTLLDSEDGMTVRQLCGQAFLGQPRASMCLKALREEGLVQRGNPCDDRRKRRFALTRQGEALANDMIDLLENTW